jgi:hypothetical protein
VTAPLTSVVCRREHWDTRWFTHWNAIFSGASPPGEHFVPQHVGFHRKTWEWAAICQALHERGLLAPGRSGCGFAVGREPLASVFARHGVNVLATDLAADQSAGTWTETGQHAASLDALYWDKVVDRPTFDARIRFLPQDMRALDPAALGTHDFIWSSCSFEHLGSLEAGLQFVLRSTALLRPGGIAVHTTEFNVSDEENTVTTGDSVIYRRRDISSLAHRLRLIGCGMERFDDFPGTAPEDIEYDHHPYYQNDRAHIKLLLHGYVATSCLLIITKGRTPSALPPLTAMPLAPGAPPSRLDRLRTTRFWHAIAPARALVRRLRDR